MARAIKLAKLVEWVNRRNSESTCAADVRLGWNLLLEEAMHHADNYGGYRYLAAQYVPKGEKPGIDGEEMEYIFPDETRRHYYLRTV